MVQSQYFSASNSSLQMRSFLKTSNIPWEDKNKPKPKFSHCTHLCDIKDLDTVDFKAQAYLMGYSSCFCKQKIHRPSQGSPGATSAFPLPKFILLSFVFIIFPCSPKLTLLVLLLGTRAKHPYTDGLFVSLSVGSCLSSLSCLRCIYTADRGRVGAKAHSQQ